jgi:hypothetical protein
MIFYFFFAPHGTLRENKTSLSMFSENKNRKRVVCATLNNNFKVCECFDCKIDRIFEMNFAPLGTLPKVTSFL